ncbi:MAG: glycosyltransferase, partial [Desulfobacterales bacterium]|nr:glycosyltransferase [Desulfobacterales bacterium]NIX00442.1 glycosyltransferase [Phycisphaerae bacterium]
ANSKYSAGYLEEVYGKRVRDIVYPGVNVNDFIYLPSYENIVLTIGQLWPHKRIKLLIEAIKHVDDVQLYVVGSGPEHKRLVGIAENLGVSDRVFFLQNLTNKELQILFTRAFSVAFVPMKEPFGIVALEAMAAGKPVIGVNEGGFIEVLDDSCSFLVPPYPLAVAEKIRYLRNNKDIAVQMGLNGLKKVKKYNWDSTAGQLLKVIEETHEKWLAKHRTPARKGARRTLFGAQYYCWYGDGIGAPHWNDNPSHGAVKDMPAMGYYASSQGTTITEHLQKAKAIGLDFFLLNLHITNAGANDYELASIENIFKVSEENDFNIKLAIQICPYETGK